MEPRLNIVQSSSTRSAVFRPERIQRRRKLHIQSVDTGPDVWTDTKTVILTPLFDERCLFKTAFNNLNK